MPSHGLTPAEQERLEQLVHQYDQAVLLRAEAARLLKVRGHDVSQLLTVLHETEPESQKLREFGKSRQVLAQIWDNLKDADYNEDVEDLRREIRKGLDQLDRGESVPLNAERIKSEGRRGLA